jgi:hypothetical protein
MKMIENQIQPDLTGNASYNPFSTVNSLSGGKTSSYMAVHYPADHNVFALVRTDNKDCLFPDRKIRQLVADKINAEFIGTLEDDMIIYTMLDLEQFTGQKINWVTGKTFDQLIKEKNDFLPGSMVRYCTIDMKIKPIAQWCYENTDLPIIMQIGFRTNEQRRAFSMTNREIDGFENFKFNIGEKNGRRQWKTLPYRKCTFPLMNDKLYKDNIIGYWNNNTSVRFAKFNNCVGCFHQNPILLNHRSSENPIKYEWFAQQERKNDYKYRFIENLTYDKISSKKVQMELFDYDFSECDSGYCGL